MQDEVVVIAPFKIARDKVVDQRLKRKKQLPLANAIALISIHLHCSAPSCGKSTVLKCPLTNCLYSTHISLFSGADLIRLV